MATRAGTSSNSEEAGEAATGSERHPTTVVASLWMLPSTQARERILEFKVFPNAHRFNGEGSVNHGPARLPDKGPEQRPSAVNRAAEHAAISGSL